MFSDASASEQGTAKLPKVLAIKSANKKIKAKNIEASGLLWLADRGQYLLISDEQYKKQPGIYFFNNGLILDVVSLADKNKLRIDDLESISTDGEFIYALSSLSHSSDDKLKAKRRKFIRFKLEGQQIGKWQEVDLYHVLKAIKSQDIEPKLALFLRDAIASHSLDIESHFVDDNVLYLGFKAPLMENNKTLIIKLTGMNKLFSGQEPVAEIWRTIALQDPETGMPMQLSDMLWEDNQLFLLSVSKDPSRQRSLLLHYQGEKQPPKVLQVFSDLKAEGLAYRPDESMFSIVFDQGSHKASKYVTLEFTGLNLK